MAKDLNRCEFTGRLGDDPQARISGGGVPVTSFSLAVNKSWRDAAGEQKQSTQWIRIVAFRRLAEICAAYLQKGSRVFIAGEYQSRRWQDQEQTKYITEVVAREMLMLDSRAKPEADPADSSKAATKTVPDSTPTDPTASKYSPYATWGQTHPGSSTDSDDDDIPF